MLMKVPTWSKAFLSGLQLQRNFRSFGLWDAFVQIKFYSIMGRGAQFGWRVAIIYLGFAECFLLKTNSIQYLKGFGGRIKATELI